MKKIFYIAVIANLFFFTNSWAACVNRGGGVFTSSADSSSVNSCISSASVGNTIHVDSGTFSWTATLTKRVSLIGGGKGTGQTPGTTQINGQIEITPTLGNDQYQLRVAYFTIYKSGTSALNAVVNWGNSTTNFNLGGTNPYNARLDHCIILGGDGGTCITTWDTLYGVIDNCTLGSSTQRHHYGIYGETVYTIANFNNSVNYPWYPGMDGGGKSIYVEDCIFWPSSDGWRAGTSNEGGRIVWRYNTVNIASGGYSQALWDIHGSQGTACAAWGHEYYGNRALTGDCQKIADVRSGQNMMFWNAGNSLDAAVQNYWGQYSVCTTTLPAEQQIHHAYYWNNRVGPTGALGTSYTGTTYSGTCGGYVNPPQAGKNYYGESTSPGITSGTLSNRPSTCTTGQGYWATSQTTGLTNLTNYVGDINTYPSRQTIEGTFYRCDSGGIWQTWYVPYTYPHPLRDETPIVPTSPTKVRIIMID